MSITFTEDRTTVNLEDLFTALAALRRQAEEDLYAEAPYDGCVGAATNLIVHSVLRRTGMVGADCSSACGLCLDTAYLGLIGAIAPAQVVKV